MFKTRKEVINRVEYEQLSSQERENYLSCGNCSNYLLTGTGKSHTNYPSIYLCNICDEQSSRVSADISGVRLITRGQHTDEDGTTGKVWWVFPKGTTKLKAVSFLESNGVVLEGYGTGVEWSPSGRRFANPVCVSEKGNSVVAVQSWGLDI